MTHSYPTLHVSDLYKNVFYNDQGIGFQMKSNAKATCINNIFYVTGDSPITETYAPGPRFLYNSFYGQAAPAQGISNIVGDPGFVDPGQDRKSTRLNSSH